MSAMARHEDYLAQAIRLARENVARELVIGPVGDLLDHAGDGVDCRGAAGGGGLADR